MATTLELQVADTNTKVTALVNSITALTTTLNTVAAGVSDLQAQIDQPANPAIDPTVPDEPAPVVAPAPVEEPANPVEVAAPAPDAAA